jgi:hypothetical protein
MLRSHRTPSGPVNLWSKQDASKYHRIPGKLRPRLLATMPPTGLACLPYRDSQLGPAAEVGVEMSEPRGSLSKRQGGRPRFPGSAAFQPQRTPAHDFAGSHALGGLRAAKGAPGSFSPRPCGMLPDRRASVSARSRRKRVRTGKGHADLFAEIRMESGFRRRLPTMPEPSLLGTEARGSLSDGHGASLAPKVRGINLSGATGQHPPKRRRKPSGGRSAFTVDHTPWGSEPIGSVIRRFAGSSGGTRAERLEEAVGSGFR